MNIHNVKKSGLYLVTKLSPADAREKYNATIVVYIHAPTIQRLIKRFPCIDYIATYFPVILSTIDYGYPARIARRRTSYFLLIKEVRPLTDYGYAKILASCLKKGKVICNPVYAPASFRNQPCYD